MWCCPTVKLSCGPHWPSTTSTADGYRHANGQKASITIGSDASEVTVNRKGVATRRVSVEGTSGEAVSVTYDSDPVENLDEQAGDDIDVFTGDKEDGYPVESEVQVVVHADSSDSGPKTVHTLVADSNRFTTEEASGDDADLLYGYDDDDLFVNSVTGHDDEDKEVTAEDFEKLLGAELDEVTTAAVVDIVAYDADGRSIFLITGEAS